MKAAVVGYTEKYGKADESAEKEEEGHVPVSEQDLDELEKVDLDSLLMSGESSTPEAEDDHETARESHGLREQWKKADVCVGSLSHRPVYPGRAVRIIRDRPGRPVGVVDTVRPNRQNSDTGLDFGCTS